jgi:enterochelin esterase family protein
MHDSSRRHASYIAVAFLIAASVSPAALNLALAQAPATAPNDAPASCLIRGFALPGPAAFKDVEVLPDRRVTFRLCAPDASAVSVTSSDIADVIPMGIGGGPSGLAMTKGD